MASVTGKDVREVGALSVQQLAFCGKQLRTCYSSWTLEGALAQLVDGGPLLLEECLPYAPDTRWADRRARGRQRASGMRVPPGPRRPIRPRPRRNAEPRGVRCGQGVGCQGSCSLLDGRVLLQCVRVVV